MIDLRGCLVQYEYQINTIKQDVLVEEVFAHRHGARKIVIKTNNYDTYSAQSQQHMYELASVLMNSAEGE